MKRKPIAATRAGIYLDEAVIRRNIRRYRRAVRWQLYDQIRDIESQVGRIMGDLLPIRWVPRRSPERYYLDELLKATSTKRFVVRYWPHGERRPIGRQVFWAYRRGSGLDEVVDRTEEHIPAPAGIAGKSDSFDRFTELVQLNRRLRGNEGLCGMVSRGLNDWGMRHIGFSSEAEFETACTLLKGDLDEAVVAATKLLRECNNPYALWEMTPEVVIDNTALYFMLLQGNAKDDQYCSLLSEADQCLFCELGVAVKSWRKLVAARLGIRCRQRPAINIEPEYAVF